MYPGRAESIGGFEFNQQSLADIPEELYLVSHPGYCLVDDEYMDLGLLPEDHFMYAHGFFNEIEEKIEEDVEVAVLEERGTDYSREFLGELEEDVDHWIETVEGKARPTTESAEDLIQILRGLEDGSHVTVAGEVNGLCVGQAGQIVEYVSDAYDLDLEVGRGSSFPNRAVERPGDSLKYV